MMRLLACLALACYSMFALPSSLKAQDESPSESVESSDSNETLAGHSFHGEAFNEGPRQEAYLMNGLGRVVFPVTTSHQTAQRFVTQGVAQLHGFWYFEAERSFRQAAAVDPDCAMAYWGMAMANKNNEKRAKGFIAEATKRKATVSRREQLYIEALDEYVNADPKKKKVRAEQATKALENILYEFPDDVEAKAFLALQLWNNRSDGIPISSYLAIDALLEQVFAVEPMHPAHHYRIHLWDYEKPERAVHAAANCGQSLPAIAHMWHMPGHTFSRLKRYDDAAWQQEASARVDHAHMIRDRVLPDQIHNFAHNNEWLIRNLNHVGRVHDAIELAKNMIELPRHPKYNTLEKRGSTSYGRTRLFETVSRFERWEELLALANTSYLEPSESEKEQVEHLRHVGRAAYGIEDIERGQTVLEELKKRLEASQQEQETAGEEAKAKAEQEAVDLEAVEKAGQEAADKARADDLSEDESVAAGEEAKNKTKQVQIEAKKSDIDKAKNAARKKHADMIRTIEQAVAELDGRKAIAEQRYEDAWKELKKATGVDPMDVAEARYLAGHKEEAIKDAKKHVDGNAGEVQPLVRYVDLLWRDEQLEEARTQFEKLRDISGNIDLDSRLFERLAPVVSGLSLDADWRRQAVPAEDVGVRPALDSLGPFRWTPPSAPHWSLADSQDRNFSLKHFQGQPIVLIFYLGYGCLHCAEQLHEFAPLTEQFQKAGIQLVAISSDDAEGLSISLANYDKGKIPFPLLSNHELDVFRAYRAYDDFENQPLHGTFLIDGQGCVRWQDINYKPFMDPKFLLEESQRLLSQPN